MENESMENGQVEDLLDLHVPSPSCSRGTPEKSDSPLRRRSVPKGSQAPVYFPFLHNRVKFNPL